MKWGNVKNGIETLHCSFPFHGLRTGEWRSSETGGKVGSSRKAR